MMKKKVILCLLLLSRIWISKVEHSKLIYKKYYLKPVAHSEGNFSQGDKSMDKYERRGLYLSVPITK